MNIDCVLNKLKNDNILMNEKKVILAFSGGPDSTFMALLLKNYLPDIHVYLYHLNHNIRKNSLDDENFVKNFSKDNDFKLYLSSKDIPKISKDKKIGLEEAGRIERYNDLKEISNMLNIHTIITGHHLDDDIETFIMNFRRGSGINGYSAIKERDGIFFRPLLSIQKSFILKYLNDKNISYCVDETNFIPNTLRNDIRINILPELKKMDSNFYNNFNEFLSTMKDEYALKVRFINSFIKDYNISKEDGEYKFNIKDAKRFFGDDLTSLFYHILDKINGNTIDVYKAQLMGINTILKSNEEKRIDISGVSLIKSFDWLIFRKNVSNLNRTIYFSDVETDETIDYISPIFVEGNIRVRKRAVGDKIKLYKRPNKSLKKLLIEKKIPAFKRDELFVICDEESILYVEMIGRSERANGGREKIYINERKNNE